VKSNKKLAKLIRTAMSLELGFSVQLSDALHLRPLPPNAYEVVFKGDVREKFTDLEEAIEKFIEWRMKYEIGFDFDSPCDRSGG
jgi:hypothetical protein